MKKSGWLVGSPEVCQETYENNTSVFSVCSCYVAELLRRVALVLRSGVTPQSSILWAYLSFQIGNISFPLLRNFRFSVKIQS